MIKFEWFWGPMCYLYKFTYFIQKQKATTEPSHLQLAPTSPPTYLYPIAFQESNKKLKNIKTLSAIVFLHTHEFISLPGGLFRTLWPFALWNFEQPCPTGKKEVWSSLALESAPFRRFRHMFQRWDSTHAAVAPWPSWPSSFLGPRRPCDFFGRGSTLLNQWFNRDISDRTL